MQTGDQKFAESQLQKTLEHFIAHNTNCRLEIQHLVQTAANL